MRWRVDQELTRRSIEPIFKENYYSYDKDEFLLDADFEFIKVRNLLNKSPKLLRDDPIMGVDYLKVINLIKQKKVLENLPYNGCTCNRDQDIKTEGPHQKKGCVNTSKWL